MFKDITPHIFKKFHCIGGWVSCTSQCVFCCCPLFCHILKWWPRLVKRNKKREIHHHSAETLRYTRDGVRVTKIPFFIFVNK